MEPLCLMSRRAGQRPDAPFAVLAHIDYPVRTWPRRAGSFDPGVFEEQYRAVLAALARSGRALEDNTRVPLRPEVVRWWYQCGGEAVCYGSDAHEPTEVARGFADAAAMAEARGLRFQRECGQRFHSGKRSSELRERHLCWWSRRRGEALRNRSFHLDRRARESRHVARIPAAQLGFHAASPPLAHVAGGTTKRHRGARDRRRRTVGRPRAGPSAAEGPAHLSRLEICSPRVRCGSHDTQGNHRNAGPVLSHPAWHRRRTLLGRRVHLLATLVLRLGRVDRDYRPPAVTDDILARLAVQGEFAEFPYAVNVPSLRGEGELRTVPGLKGGFTWMRWSTSPRLPGSSPGSRPGAGSRRARSCSTLAGGSAGHRAPRVTGQATCRGLRSSTLTATCQDRRGRRGGIRCPMPGHSRRRCAVRGCARAALSSSTTTRTRPRLPAPGGRCATSVTTASGCSTAGTVPGWRPGSPSRRTSPASRAGTSWPARGTWRCSTRMAPPQSRVRACCSTPGRQNVTPARLSP